MRAAPPARGVRGIAAVRGPAVAAVVLQTVERADVLREAHGLEHAHVLAAGEDERALDLSIDVQHALHDVLALVELAVVEHRPHGREEVAQDHRLSGDGGHAPRRNFLIGMDLEVLLQIPLAGTARIERVIE